MKPRKNIQHFMTYFEEYVRRQLISEILTREKHSENFLHGEKRFRNCDSQSKVDVRANEVS
jgi:hypothetical protein